MLKVYIFLPKIFLLSILFVNLQKVYKRLYKNTNKIFKRKTKMENLKTTKQMARELQHSKVISMHRSILQENPTAKPWSIYRAIGAKFNLTQQAIFYILKKYNEI